MLNHFFEISLDYIDINKILNNNFNNKHGAAVFFIGKIRDFNDNKKVIGITYDMYDDLVINIFCEIYNNYKNQNDIKIYVSHFKGYVKVGNVSTLIIVESLNRKKSFNICNMILEDIKNKLPIWKYEHYFTENSNWIDGNILK